MTLRKALVASPSAVLVAVLAHFVAFGSSHAPGDGRAVEILGGLGATLGVGVLFAFLSGVFAGRISRLGERASIFAPLVLAVAGVAAFGVIEISEGHAAVASLFEAACAAVPLAYVVAWLTRAIASIAGSAGVAAGSFIRRGSRGLATCVAVATRDLRACARYGLVARNNLRGRAPPLFI